MRRKLVAGNWKMHGLKADLSEVTAIATAAGANPSVDAALCVPFTLIAAAAVAAGDMPVGAQDVHQAAKGAHTGCISAAMLVEAGAGLTIVGHSERRADQYETDAQVKAKAEAAHAAGLGVILCIGETLDERDAGQAEAVVTAQVAGSLPEGADAAWLSLAYEPVWAIGTGRTPTEVDVAAMHGAIRAKLTALIGDEAAKVRILYGGSVNGANAASLLACADVDGALVGGASLTAEKFVPIIEAAASLSQA
ncbi:triose-phosphate isomerase [Sphingomonas sp. G-3-2-10]|uniref:triose-phosphate isomerase n=1 Tax=Sphingomonas sp. G-3-2-10 TaxID=2728838 RepID=UPI00146EB831|nr:triose-phosphate isomerase [Sphingomonas sp. G-3-2-10]NML04760.1 triose-phosphate isomerase [Sphingomonas sp. G-3-2-10]